MTHPRWLNGDTVTGAIALALGLGALSMIPAHVSPDGLGAWADMRSPAFFPLVVSTLLIVLALLLVLRGFASATGPAMPARRRDGAEPGIAPRRVALVGGVLIAATAGIFVIGYVVTAMLLVAGLARALGYRRVVILVPLAVGVPLAIQALFQGVLRVLLPTGMF